MDNPIAKYNTYQLLFSASQHQSWFKGCGLGLGATWIAQNAHPLNQAHVHYTLDSPLQLQGAS